ncbi:hypothetical protein SAMN05421760_11369 [Neptunomonas antarctica]|uniref:Uncharacterized protein n=1 Tax=Neptunomonas antarctica TaxID=619304 RepID=A0A1N7P9G6_9GAMM|nr:hypothetical protein SAMN05421760_11369 [Neptunomonas antarctica]
MATGPVPGKASKYRCPHPKPPLIGRLEGIGLELKRISALLAQQPDPNLVTDIDASLNKRIQKARLFSGIINSKVRPS